MNGALPPKSVLVDSNSLIVPIRVGTGRAPRAPPFKLSLGNRLHIPALRAGEKLPRTADLVLRVGHHLVQLRDPADGAREREDRREELHRDADRLLYDARIEVDIR